MENDLDYYLSAYLSNKILSHPFTHYDGILYPSVQDRLATSNLALTQNGFLNNFIPTEVTHDVLISIKNRGALFQGIHRSLKFDLAKGIKERIIIWEDLADEAANFQKRIWPMACARNEISSTDLFRLLLPKAFIPLRGIRHFGLSDFASNLASLPN